MLIRDAVAHGATQLDDNLPHQTARRLLAQVLGKEPVYVIAHGDDPLTAAHDAAYQALLKRAAADEPIPYILGTAPFRHYDFMVTPATLIPRPETEMLVEMVIEFVNARRTVGTTHGSPLRRVVDVGTGSGCIAISLALELDLPVEAVDVSMEALTIAQKNAEKYDAAVTFHHGDLLSSLITHHASRITCLIANLPYITDDEWTTLDPAVKLFEPATALRGGRNGLDLIDKLLDQAQTKLRPDGAIFLEIGWKQGEKTIALAQRYFPEAAIRCHEDHAGHDRIVSIILPTS